MTEDNNEQPPVNDGVGSDNSNEVVATNNDDDPGRENISDDEEEAAMKRMLAIQEEHDQEEILANDDGGNPNGAAAGDDGNGNDNGGGPDGNGIADQNPALPEFGNGDDVDAEDFPVMHPDHNHHGSRRSFVRLHYTSLSFLLAVTHIIYVLRTRKQAYLALLYLTSSKLSYIIMGNVAIAGIIGLFFQTVQTFLNGLRLMETETIIDHIRWNVTETCIALTMFRQEINVKIMGIFLILILGKCLHWAVELRENHLRMTEEVFYLLDGEEDDALLFGSTNDNSDEENVDSNANADQVFWLWKAIGLFLPKPIRETAYKLHRGIPRVRKKHLKLFTLMNILYVFDVLALTYCVSHILEEGPSVFIMLLFESSILMASIMSTSALFMCHVFDSMLNMMQKIIVERHQVDDSDSEQAEAVTAAPEAAVVEPQPQQQQSRNHGGRRQATLASKIVQKMASAWRDQRVTATFIIELMALAAKFLFHLILFVVVFTLYGLPINIIRDFYLAFRRLKERLLAFASYRRLTSNMNTRFESVTTEEELDAAGRTCIICRDTMEVHGINGDCKKLPICEHVFHKHCLREWLVQQQSCPTCRGDLLANEARARALKKEKEDEERKKKEEEAATAAAAVATDGESESGGAVAVEAEGKDVKDPAKMTKKVTPRPCLYKVKSSVTAGTSIFDITEKLNCKLKLATRKEIKILAQGTMVVCIDAGVYTCVESNGEYETNIYLKTPGGWILNDDMELVVELKPNRPLGGSCCAAGDSKKHSCSTAVAAKA